MKIKEVISEFDYEKQVSSTLNTIPCEQKLTQQYLAQLATTKCKSELLWNTTEGCWHQFSHESGLWNRIKEEHVISILMKILTQLRLDESEKIKVSGTNRSHALQDIERAENRNFLTGTESLMRSMSSLWIEGKAFDADPYLVGLENNLCLDLRTCNVRTIQQTDHLTKRIDTPYIEGQACPVWEKSVLTWTRGDMELAKFLQVWCGYCLSGLTSFQGFLFLYGSGRNGKSVFLNVISRLLGPYAIAMQSDTLMMKSSSGSGSSDVARLNGVRFATCNELPEGKHFNEELLKSLTGNDTLTARFMYKDFFDFKPSLKLMICGNHTPIIKGTDDGIWRRMNLVPFVAKIETVDPYLTEKLNAESAGILNWMIEGWKLFQQEGLVAPKVVTDATAEYKCDMDIVAEWLDVCVERHDESSRARVPLLDLYKSYESWCLVNGFRGVPTSKSFYRKLRDTYLGEPERGSSCKFYSRIRLKAVNEDDFKTPMNHRFDKS